MTTYYTTAKAGQPIKNNGGTALHAGNIGNRNLTNNLSLSTNGFKTGFYGSRVPLAVSPYSSGNVGTLKPLSAGRFAEMERGKYLILGYSNRIAQTNNSILSVPASDFSRKMTLINAFYGARRLHITSWDYVTGVATKGGNAGDLVTFGADHAAAVTDAVPGELTYMYGAILPRQDDYKAVTG